MVFGLVGHMLAYSYFHPSVPLLALPCRCLMISMPISWEYKMCKIRKMEYAVWNGMACDEWAGGEEGGFVCQMME